MDKLTGVIANTLCEYLSPDKAREAAQEVMINIAEHFTEPKIEVRDEPDVPLPPGYEAPVREPGESDASYGRKLDAIREQALNACKDGYEVEGAMAKATRVWGA